MRQEDLIDESDVHDLDSFEAELGDMLDAAEEEILNKLERLRKIQDSLGISSATSPIAESALRWYSFFDQYFFPEADEEPS